MLRWHNCQFSFVHLTHSPLDANAQVNLDELFFAEELAESVGSLEKNPVIIDEDAPLKV